jgi:aminoglycoside phosphotransferase (APT) family kinase protein
VSAGGGVLQMARTPAGEAVIVRVGFADERSSPRRAAEGLSEVAGLDVPAPRLLAAGRTGEMWWSVESRLRGEVPTRVSRRLLEQLAAVLASLPCAAAPVEATPADLEAIAEVYPTYAPQLGRFAGLVERATQDVPSVLGHRDVWPGNVLVHDGELAGLVDWGSWHPQAAPGADLLQFCTAVMRRQHRQSLGAAWLTRPWLDPAIRSVLRPQLERLDIEAGPSYLEALGVAWWAAEVAGTLERFPQRACDEAWSRTNVGAVMDSPGP